MDVRSAPRPQGRVDFLYFFVTIARSIPHPAKYPSHGSGYLERYRVLSVSFLVLHKIHIHRTFVLGFDLAPVYARKIFFDKLIGGP